MTSDGRCSGKAHLKGVQPFLRASGPKSSGIVDPLHRAGVLQPEAVIPPQWLGLDILPALL
eukprot:3760425-Prorocentrum_lima.AAC.1